MAKAQLKKFPSAEEQVKSQSYREGQLVQVLLQKVASEGSDIRSVAKALRFALVARRSPESPELNELTGPMRFCCLKELAATSRTLTQSAVGSVPPMLERARCGTPHDNSISFTIAQRASSTALEDWAWILENVASMTSRW